MYLYLSDAGWSACILDEMKNRKCPMHYENFPKIILLNHNCFICFSHRKKTPLKEVGNLKAKKSPSGWRSIFSKGNRQSSMKHKNYKTGLSRIKDQIKMIFWILYVLQRLLLLIDVWFLYVFFVESLGTGMERKAITEEDVQTWKRRRLRGAKSAESLLVLPQSTSIDSTKRMSRLVDENMLMKMFQGESQTVRHCVNLLLFWGVF